MSSCTFFGHRDVTEELEPILYSVITDLIKNQKADKFYVGNHGAFDYTVIKILKSLSKLYSNICYFIVLAYLPTTNSGIDFSQTIFPDGLENVPPKFAIKKRNIWMIEKSDIVVTYVTRGFGGAAQFKELAEKKGKRIINLTDYINTP